MKNIKKEESNMNNFKCSRCKTVKPINKNGGTGYALIENKTKKVCYNCCGELDKLYMERESKITLYICEDKNKKLYISNWPGTLIFAVNQYKYGKHNIAGKRLDVWFKDHKNNIWHGCNIGDNTQILHCKKLKGN